MKEQGSCHRAGRPASILVRDNSFTTPEKSAIFPKSPPFSAAARRIMRWHAAFALDPGDLEAPMRRKILTALDGSKTSESILPHLEMLLRNEDADVTLARVAIPGGPGAEEIEEYLKALASSLESKGASVDTAILKGDPAAEIVRRAIEGGFHLIAMCSRGKTGLKRLILGSVAEAVLRRSTVPVLIVHPTEKSADAPKIRRIVVPLDGTHRAAGILASVADLAGAAGAKIGFV